MRTSHPCPFYAKLEHHNCLLWLAGSCSPLLLHRAHTCFATPGAAAVYAVFCGIKQHEEGLVVHLRRLFNSLSASSDLVWGRAITAMNGAKFLPSSETRKYHFCICLAWNAKNNTVGNSFFLPSFFHMFRGIILSIFPFILAGIFLFSLFHQDLLTKHQQKKLLPLTSAMKERSLRGPSLKAWGQKSNC